MTSLLEKSYQYQSKFT